MKTQTTLILRFRTIALKKYRSLAFQNSEAPRQIMKQNADKSLDIIEIAPFVHRINA